MAPDAKAESDGPELKMTTFIAPACMLALRYFKVDLSIYLNELRVAFACMVVTKFLVIGYIYFCSKSNKQKGSVIVTEKGVDGAEKKKTMTISEYDVSQTIKSLGQAALALCITCGIHYKWGNPTPLLFQCLMGPIGIFDDALFRIYVLGNPAEGKLERPFKPPPSPFQELMGGDASDSTEKKVADAKDQKHGKKDKKKD